MSMEREGSNSVENGKTPSGEVRPSRHYMPQLDGLRAFAVFGVMLAHFRPIADVPSGVWGVQIFFVLSGFLITGILLAGRAERAGSTRCGRDNRHFLRNFYIRRGLRIFPLFYLVLLITALANVPPVRETWGWHLTYASNIYFSLRGDWNGPVSHFWSLAVEEQFYLFWPWLIILLPSRYLLPAILIAIASAPIFKGIGRGLGWNAISLQVLPVACLDFLGMGALLALFRYRQPQRFEALASSWWYRMAGLLLAFVLYIPYVSNRVPRLAPLGLPAQLLGDDLRIFLNAIVFAWLVHCAAVGFNGRVGKLMLENRPMIYLGKISYGLYLYHNFMPLLLAALLVWLPFSLPQRGSLVALTYVVATIIVATISWFLFEQPILRCKEKFANPSPGDGQTSGSGETFLRRFGLFARRRVA